MDSKWSAVAELEALEAADDPIERETLAREVERQVALRAREVAQYLDPSLTAPVAVAAVPDAAYEVLRRAHADAFSRGVVIVPYSTALPVLLFLYSLAHRFGDADDARSALEEVVSVLDAMQLVLENKVARAATMVSNGVDELRSGLGKARGSIARGRTAAAVAAETRPRADRGCAEGRPVARAGTLRPMEFEETLATLGFHPATGRTPKGVQVLTGRTEPVPDLHGAEARGRRPGGAEAISIG